MSIHLVETYVVRAEKRAEFNSLLNEFVTFKGSHPQLFQGLISWGLHKQYYGQPAGMFIEMWEYENLAELEKNDKRIFSDDQMKKISEAFHKLVEPATFSACIWSKVA